MRALKHPPLLFWLVVCLLLAGTTLALHEQGRRSGTDLADMPTADSKTARLDNIEAFRLRLAELPKHAGLPEHAEQPEQAAHNDKLRDWAETTGEDAARWAVRHANNPRTAVLFRRAADTASELAAAAAAGDSDGSSAAVAELYRIGDLLAAGQAGAGAVTGS